MLEYLIMFREMLMICLWKDQKLIWAVTLISAFTPLSFLKGILISLSSISAQDHFSFLIGGYLGDFRFPPMLCLDV